jgi:hypothetical protein
MDACLTVTHGVTRSSLRQLPKLQRVPGCSWHLQGLAGRVACPGGVQQPLRVLDGAFGSLAGWSLRLCAVTPAVPIKKRTRPGPLDDQGIIL